MSNQKAVKFGKLEKVRPDAGGIDIGSTEIFTCVPDDSRENVIVRNFGTFTGDLNQILLHLNYHNVKTVAMESTGIYWIPLYSLLSQHGIEVVLCNARDVKNVPGRKSDVQDCQWLQKLHSYGLLNGSFRPSEDICELRDLLRHRSNLISERSRQIQHMQKALHLMNIQLDNVITDITGVTGLTIIRAILEGERDPEKLSEYRDPRCSNPKDVIEKSLVGNYKNEHLFQLKQSLELYDYYTIKIEECDNEIEKIYEALPKLLNIEQTLYDMKKRKKVKNTPDYDLQTYLYQLCGVDLTTIPGVNVLTIQTIISEIGIDMSKWPTVKRFTSWLGLCPNNDISGGKVLKTRTKKTKNRATLALRQAAQSLYKSYTGLGAYYRRMRAKFGPAKANVAAAHKLARIIYYMLKDKTEFKETKAQEYEAQYKNRSIQNLKKWAEQLGVTIVEATE